LTAKPPLERVQGSEKILERLMLIIPGFRGYKLREQRREADRIVRDYIYRSLEHSRDDLMGSFQSLTDAKATELMEPMNRLIAKLDRVTEKINRASYGYSGFFDSIKVDEPELDNMLTYDTQLMDLVRKIGETTASFRAELTEGKLEDARSNQEALNVSIDALESAFDHRKAVIEGVKV
jgi:DNA repair ATPase RecN